jgi:hypothetical protein
VTDGFLRVLSVAEPVHRPSCILFESYDKRGAEGAAGHDRKPREATRPMGSPLHADLHRIHNALSQQLDLLGQGLEPPPAGGWWLAGGYRLEKVIGDLVFPTSGI